MTKKQITNDAILDKLTKLDSRIGGAYAAIASLNKAFARSIANVQQEPHSRQALQQRRYDATQHVAVLLSRANSILSDNDFRPDGATRFHLNKALQGLRNYLTDVERGSI